MELDDFLEGKASQYREVQDFESRRFKSLFPSMVVMNGGVGEYFRNLCMHVFLTLPSSRKREYYYRYTIQGSFKFSNVSIKKYWLVQL